MRDGIYAAAALTGLPGTAFHLFNVTGKPGGFSWQNLSYSAPLGTPAALVLSGATGFLAERARDNRVGVLPTIGGLPAGRVIAAATGVGILGTAAEARLLHFRGAYHNPFMYAPITVPPVTAALLGGVAFGAARTPRPLTRWWLRLTAAFGFIGSGFYALGVAGNMGGWQDATPAAPRLPRDEPRARAGCAVEAGLIALIDRRYDGFLANGLRFHEGQPALAKSGRRGRQPRRIGHNLLLRLSTRKQDALRFLTDPSVPFTNKLAERDGRMMKLRQKISGGFRAQDGAKDFAVIRSVLSTARKQRWNMLQTLTSEPTRLMAHIRVV